MKLSLIFSLLLIPKLTSTSKPPLVRGVIDTGIIHEEGRELLNIAIPSSDNSDDNNENNSNNNNNNNNNNNVFEPLIVGGETTNSNDFDWIVKTASPFATCTASLIHEDVVLSAAHCQAAFATDDGVFISPHNFDGRNAVIRKVKRLFRHPGYDFNRELIANDIMVIVLESPVPTSLIRTVSLNADVTVPSVKDEDVELTVIGFGLTSHEGRRPQRLQQGDLEYVSRDICEFWTTFFDNVDYEEGILCAGAPDGVESVCNGDSGGPLILRDRQTHGDLQVGVTSFGNQCESFPIPNGFTRVSAYYDWIQEQICLHSANPPADCPVPTEDTTAVLVNVTLQLDENPSQTTWAVRNRDTREVEFVGPIGVPAQFGLMWTTFQLTPGRYTFELHDKGDDGLTAPILLGTFTGWTEIRVEVNGKQELIVPRIIGDFKTLQETDFEIVAQTGGSDPPPPPSSSAPGLSEETLPTSDGRTTTSPTTPNSLSDVTIPRSTPTPSALSTAEAARSVPSTSSSPTQSSTVSDDTEDETTMAPTGTPKTKFSEISEPTQNPDNPLQVDSHAVGSRGMTATTTTLLVAVLAISLWIC